MSFKSKRTLVTLITGIGLAVGYSTYALGRHAPAAGDIGAWALAMLVFIGGAILASIIIQIAFHIIYSVGVAVRERTREDVEVERIIVSDTAEDELDKLIGLKSSRAGYVCTGLGFVVALAALAFLDTSTVAALHVVMGACFAGALLEGCVSIRLYEKGVGNA